MSQGPRPRVDAVGPTLEAVHPVLGCSDVDRSIRFFEALGFAATWRDTPSAPRYACVQRDGVEVHLQWVDMSQWDRVVDRPVLRFLVRDVDALHAQFRARPEATDMKAPFDSSWGTRECHLRDPDGNGLQFYWPR